MDDRKKKRTPRPYETLVIWIFFILGGLILFSFISKSRTVTKEISFSEFRKEMERDNIREVTIQELEVKGVFNNPIEYKEGESITEFKTRLPFSDPNIADELVEKGVEVRVKKKQVFWDMLWGYLPWFIILLVFWFMILRQFQGPSSRAFSFGKSRVKKVQEDRPKVTFEDVAGVEEAKDELKEVIEFLKSPQKFRRVGARIPKGVLLLGPPGTGKTLLAKAVAGEAGVPFLSISGSNFVELFVGVGAARVRDLFSQAKSQSPCIIFIDEIDAVGRLRGAGLGGGHDEREQTLNQLLVEMDGFDTSEGIIVMAATNRPDILDPALLRPGRFDRQIVVDRPDVKGREEILKIHSKKVSLDPSVDLSKIARGTPGFSGADLENLVNEAALLAAREGRDKVTNSDLEEAKDKVMMGAQRKSMVLSDEEKEKIAVHEAGHALVSKRVPGTDPIHKVTIIPRGRALGITQQLPVDDKHIYSKGYLKAQLVVLLGGREAEKSIFGETSTGAGNDLEKATEIARKMVCEWGMSDKLGPVTFGKVEEEVFLGRELGVKKTYSEEMARIIDEEIRRFVLEAEEKARSIIEENRESLIRLKDALLERETLEESQIDEIIGKRLKTNPKT